MRGFSDFLPKEAQLILCTACLAGVAWAAVPEKDSAQAAVQAGKPIEALASYRVALTKVKEGSDDDQRIRESIINLVKKMPTKPTLPEEFERFMVRGRLAAELAKTSEGFVRAGNEFRQAAKTAPWVADAYFNLAVVLDKAGKYKEAIRSLKLYMLAAPNGTNLKEAKQLL